LRGVAPVVNRIDSRSVVFPAPYGPTRATARGPDPPFLRGMASPLNPRLVGCLALREPRQAGRWLVGGNPGLSGRLTRPTGPMLARLGVRRQFPVSLALRGWQSVRRMR
jgi:hypothetical protein